MSQNSSSYYTAWDDDDLEDRSSWFNSMDSAFGSYERSTRHGPLNLTHHRFHPSRFPGGWDAWRNVPNEWQALLVEYSEPLVRKLLAIFFASQTDELVFSFGPTSLVKCIICARGCITSSTGGLKATPSHRTPYARLDIG